MGKLKLNSEGYGFVEITNAYSGGGAVHSAGDPLAPRPGTTVPFRACDWYAWQLSQLDGAPKCRLYWPEAERDKAIATSVAYLKKYAERFKYDPKYKDLYGEGSWTRARLVFPIRDRPAKAEEVRDGKAIFALTQEAEVSVVKGLALPARARWVQGKKSTDGLIWQAEEARGKDGKRQRYYGFVGSHSIAKVSADQIEFADTKERKP